MEQYDIEWCQEDVDKYNLPEDQLIEFCETFTIFAGGCGEDDVIGPKELKDVMNSLGQFPTDEDIDAMVQEVDEDGNGEIDFGEFLSMITKKMQGG